MARMKDKQKGEKVGDRSTSTRPNNRRTRRSSSRITKNEESRGERNSPSETHDKAKISVVVGGNTEEANHDNDSFEKKRNHFTRSKNNAKSLNIPKPQFKDDHPKMARSGKCPSRKPSMTVDACATIMAELDPRSYHRSLIKDADNIVDRLLQPMALPWTHKIVPVARNIPCDIDEMIDVLTADDGTHTPFRNGNFGFGQFETGRLRSGESLIRHANSSENFRMATRRSSDPGIIQFSTLTLPGTTPFRHQEHTSLPHSRFISYSECDDTKGGETSLRCFEAMQARKRRRIEQARSYMASFQISVKVNSSSTRSSIFTEPGREHADSVLIKSDVLEAVLPLEVESGRKTTLGKAKIAAKELGTYDIGHGSSDLQTDGNPKRVVVGRTRLVWTSKESSDHNQRGSFTSLISGKHLENGSHVRPRNIRVRVRVDGMIYDGNKIADNPECKEDGNNGPCLQASIDCDQLVRTLFDEERVRLDHPTIRPPIFECVPDSSGTIHVTCAVPGSILLSSVTPIFNNVRAKYNSCCTVCWKSTSGGLEVRECKGCGLLAHDQCCLDPWKAMVIADDDVKANADEWLCNVCSYQQQESARICSKLACADRRKSSIRKLREPIKEKDQNLHSKDTTGCEPGLNVTKEYTNEVKCAICMLSGGAMSRVSTDGELHWVHEICRIWTACAEVAPPRNSAKVARCALCATTDKFEGESGDEERLSAEMKVKKRYSPSSVVKCAAAGCHVYVHPMCALVSTLTSQMTNGSKPKSGNVYIESKQRDYDLCSQHTLTYASVHGDISGVRCKVPVPIFFCGIHNPARERSFCGLYPGGEIIGREEILKIPSI